MKMLKKLEAMLLDKKYLAIDEMLMLSKESFAKLPKIITRAKTQSQPSDLPFGGVNIILLDNSTCNISKISPSILAV